jgi:hypothetical protein
MVVIAPSITTGPRFVRSNAASCAHCQAVTTEPAAYLDELLGRWDTDDYEAALDELDDLVEEQFNWLQATAEDPDEALTTDDVDHLRKGLTDALAAVRNADQQRRDNLRRAL